MQELIIFENKEFGQVRTLDENGKVLFCGNDVAKVLGYKDTINALKQHCKVDGVVFRHIIDSLGREQSAKFITESNLYRLIANSKLPAAEKFEGWVFEEVLPSIRQNGGYISNQENLSDEQLLAKAYIVAQNVMAMKDKQIEEMKPKAEYFDALVDRNLLTNFRDTAKELQIKQTDFMTYLFNNDFLFYDKYKQIRPYAEKNKGYFEVKECFNGKWTGLQTLITPKGRETFRLLLGGAR